MRPLVAFGAFWYDFIVGDDWVIAAVIAVILVALKLLSMHPWWLLPVAVIAVLGVSVWRAARS
jgi:hypothetical protein